MCSSDLADNWQLQLEELVALRSIYGDDFRVQQAHALQEPSPSPAEAAHSSRDAAGAELETDVDLEGLLTSCPPPLLRHLARSDTSGAQGNTHSSASTGGPAPPAHNAHNGCGAAGSSMLLFTCEATVHVDIPEAGIQLMVVPSSGQAKMQQEGEGHGKQQQDPNGLGQQQQEPGGQGNKYQGQRRHQQQHPQQHQHVQQHQQAQQHQPLLQSSNDPVQEHQEGPRQQQQRRHQRSQHQEARRHAQPQLPPLRQQPPLQQQQQQQQLHTTHQPHQSPEHTAPTAPEPIPLPPPPCTRTPPAAPPVSSTAGAFPPLPSLSQSCRAPGISTTSPQSSVDGAPEAAPNPAPVGSTLHHLPPLVVRLYLPATYPSQTAPHAHVSAIWLDPKDGSRLVDALQQKWQPGMPVLYEWLDWVQSSALSHLGLQSSSPSEPLPLLLKPRSSSSTIEEDGCGSGWGGENIDNVCRSIQCYATSRARMLFQSSTCLCSICFEERLGAKCVLLDCNHAFCWDCTSTYFKTQLQSGQVEGMRCPDPSCKEPVPPYLLRAMFTPEEYAQWERLLLQRTLDKMDDVVFCPRCEAISIEDKDHCAECPSCLYAFCGVCLGSWHPGVACLSPEERLMSLQRRGVGGKGLKSVERQRMDMDFMNQIKSLQLIKSTTKRCPGCHADIERSEGCNKMKCTYCNTAFCYRCGQEVVGYDHFSADTCPIFDRAEVERWNAMYQMQGAHPGWLRQAPQRANNIQFAPCVVCGQVNVKEGGNNLIRCYACRQFYCCLCREWLRYKPGLHFGPSKCKQHSS